MKLYLQLSILKRFRFVQIFALSTLSNSRNPLYTGLRLETATYQMNTYTKVLQEPLEKSVKSFPSDFAGY